MKLWVHKWGDKYRDAELVLNRKDFPDLKLGDLVEIYHKDGVFSRLILQYNNVFEDFTTKDTISVEENIAKTFKLKYLGDVVVGKVEKEKVWLFKEVYKLREKCAI